LKSIKERLSKSVLNVFEEKNTQHSENEENEQKQAGDIKHLGEGVQKDLNFFLETF